MMAQVKTIKDAYKRAGVKVTGIKVERHRSTCLMEDGTPFRFTELGKAYKGAAVKIEQAEQLIADQTVHAKAYVSGNGSGYCYVFVTNKS